MNTCQDAGKLGATLRYQSLCYLRRSKKLVNLGPYY